MRHFVEPNEAASVGGSLPDLERATSYHYRFCAQDSTQQGGPQCGEDRTFKTQSFACGDTVTTSVRFTGNVECPIRDFGVTGIIVGAPGIEIDMNGFELSSGHYVLDARPGIDNRAGAAVPHVLCGTPPP